VGFNPDELQMLSIGPVPSSRMSPSSMHTSVLCMDSFIKKTVEQYNMHRMILWYILRTNVLLLNLWFRVLPVEEVIRLNDLSLSSHCAWATPGGLDVPEQSAF